MPQVIGTLVRRTKRTALFIANDLWHAGGLWRAEEEIGGRRPGQRGDKSARGNWMIAAYSLIMSIVRERRPCQVRCRRDIDTTQRPDFRPVRARRADRPRPPTSRRCVPAAITPDSPEVRCAAIAHLQPAGRGRCTRICRRFACRFEFAQQQRHQDRRVMTSAETVRRTARAESRGNFLQRS